jgi:hypothetical protein
MNSVVKHLIESKLVEKSFMQQRHKNSEESIKLSSFE